MCKPAQLRPAGVLLASERTVRLLQLFCAGQRSEVGLHSQTGREGTYAPAAPLAAAIRSQYRAGYVVDGV